MSILLVIFLADECFSLSFPNVLLALSSSRRGGEGFGHHRRVDFAGVNCADQLFHVRVANVKRKKETCFFFFISCFFICFPVNSLKTFVLWWRLRYQDFDVRAVWRFGFFRRERNKCQKQFVKTADFCVLWFLVHYSVASVVYSLFFFFWGGKDDLVMIEDKNWCWDVLVVCFIFWWVRFVSIYSPIFFFYVKHLVECLCIQEEECNFMVCIWIKTRL